MPRLPSNKLHRRSTMKDVAVAAGVSATTVSFVINDVRSANISEDTKERVLATVAQLNYRPNAAAALLRTNRSHTIGFVTHSVASEQWAGEIILGAQRAAWESNQLLTIIDASHDDEALEAGVAMLLERRVDGFIYAETGNDLITPPALLLESPAVVVNAGSTDPRFSSIEPDEIEGGRIATQELLLRGHRRIGFLNMDTRPGHRPAVGRQTGYESALAEYGIEFDPDLVNYGNSNADDGYLNAHKLMDLLNPPTALFCGTDRMAMGAYDALRERGLSVPGDVSLVGFDDQWVIGKYLRPALSTVALPFFEMGWRAVKFLNAQKHSHDFHPTTTVVPCTFVGRDSVAPPGVERSVLHKSA